MLVSYLHKKAPIPEVRTEARGAPKKSGWPAWTTRSGSRQHDSPRRMGFGAGHGACIGPDKRDRCGGERAEASGSAGWIASFVLTSVVAAYAFWRLP
jgi:hypothetical protein